MPPVVEVPAAKQPSRWVVVHSGSRDRYEIPRALDEREVLCAFVTDWYSKLDRFPAGLLNGFSPLRLRNWLERRYSCGLQSRRVIDSKVASVLFEMGRKLGCSWADHKNFDKMLGRRAAEVATRAQAHLLSTSYYAAEAFRCYQGTGRRVLFQIHPSPLSLRRLYERFLKRGGLFEGLRDESEMTASDVEVEQWEDEARLADRIIVSSEFTKRSVNGVKATGAPIFVVPYGVNGDLFQPRLNHDGHRTLRVLFVGSKIARKGLHILLNVWKELRPGSATLRIAGAGGTDLRILKEFPGVGDLLPRLSQTELVHEYQSADLFVLPSLAEGFGHVYLEALACGTPVIGTENSAVPDLLTTGNCGFVVTAGDASSLGRCLESLLSRPAALCEMRVEARRVAELHSWARFRSAVHSACTYGQPRNGCQPQLRGAMSSSP